MDLFIETDEMRARRIDGEQGATHRALFSIPPAASTAEADGEMGARPDASYSIEQESYRREIAYDRDRARRRKALAVLRAVTVAVFVPVLLLCLFVGSYVLTCILNGASPREVVELLGELLAQIVEAATSAVRAASGLGA